MEKTILLLILNFLLFFSISAQQNQGTNTNENAETSSAQMNQKDSVDGGEERKNFFLGAGVKMDVYMNDNGVHDFGVWKKPTFGGQVFVGKWFNQYLGARVLLEAGKLTPYFQNMNWKEKENYILGRLDVMFDLTNCLRSYSPDNFYNLIPFVGIGGAHAFGAENRPDGKKSFSSFLFGGGLLNTFSLSDKLSAYLNLGLDVVDAKFDGWKGQEKGSKKFNGIVAASIGVVYDF